jgi:hypothetical protein
VPVFLEEYPISPGDVNVLQDWPLIGSAFESSLTSLFQNDYPNMNWDTKKERGVENDQG